MDSKQRLEEAAKKAAVLKKALQSSDGEKIIEGLYDEYMERESHVRGDSHETAFREGQRSVVLLLNDLVREN